MKRARQEEIASQMLALQEELSSIKRQKAVEIPEIDFESDENEDFKVEFLDPEFGGYIETVYPEDTQIEIVDSDEEIKIEEEEGASCTVKLDQRILNILGDKIDEDVKGPPIHPELAQRLKYIIKMGLNKETLLELLKKHASPKNCPMEAPKLNLEVAAAISNVLQHRDTKMRERQDILSKALAAISSGLTLAIEEGKNLKIIKDLTDAAKLLAHLFNRDSTYRRNGLLPALAPEVRALSKSQPIDLFLFGESLSEKVKAAKAVERTAKDLRPIKGIKNFQAPRPQPLQGNFRRGTPIARKGETRPASRLQYKPRATAQLQQSQSQRPRPNIPTRRM